MFNDLHINEKSGVPIWVQIRNHITFLIKSNKLNPGDVLPTVRELAAEFGVNYNTVHKVYQDLEADGLICSSRGKRSFVAEVERDQIELPEAPVDLVIDELVKVALENGLTLQDVLLRVELRYTEKER